MRTSRSVRLSQQAAGLVQMLPQKITVTKQRAIKEDIHVYAHTNTDPQTRVLRNAATSYYTHLSKRHAGDCAHKERELRLLHYKQGIWREASVCVRSACVCAGACMYAEPGGSLQMSSLVSLHFLTLRHNVLSENPPHR